MKETLWSWLRLKNYGVLGTQLAVNGKEVRMAPTPDETVVMVDPAGLHHIHASASGAGGASRSIYRFIGLVGSFPLQVRQAITRECEAKLHCYNGKHVIHVVGPNFTRGNWARDDAVGKLAVAYSNVFREFAVSKKPCLRLLPISGGIFSGPFAAVFPSMTSEAISAAIATMQSAHPEVFQIISNAHVELCVYRADEWE